MPDPWEVAEWLGAAPWQPLRLRAEGWLVVEWWVAPCTAPAAPAAKEQP